MAITRFGRLPDGALVEEIRLVAGRLEARLLTWGAVLRDLIVPDRRGQPRRVVLGLETMADYLAHSPNFGAVCGRVANRIGWARFQLDGREYRLDANLGVHTLHGGRDGFSRRLWRIERVLEGSVTLGLVSEDGEMGFPGTLRAFATYALEPPAALRVTLEATTDAPTVVNLAPHPYFVLDDSPDVLDHCLTVNAAHYLPTDADLVPTGEIRPVEGTRFDFRAGRRLGEADAERQGHDVTLVVRRAGATTAPQPVARLESASGDLSLTVLTTEPAIQLYDASSLSLPVAGLGGRRYGPRAGLAIEPQGFPDAPNHLHFPSIVLRPGERRRQETVFAFA